jgi:hypothetical protein
MDLNDVFYDDPEIPLQMMRVYHYSIPDLAVLLFGLFVIFEICIKAFNFFKRIS